MLNFRTQHPKGSKTLFSTRMYGPLAYTPRYGKRAAPGESADNEEEELYTDSPWPARNAAPFNVLNAFMERLVAIDVSDVV